MAEEFRKQLCDVKSSIEQILHPDHQAVAKMSELLTSFEAFVMKKTDPFDIIPHTEKVKSVVFPPKKKIVGLDFIFEGGDFLEEGRHSVPLSLLIKYAKFLRKFMGKKRIFVPKYLYFDSIGRGMLNETEEFALIPGLPDVISDHHLFYGYKRFTYNLEDLNFEKVLEEKLPDFEDQPVGKRKKIKAITIPFFASTDFEKAIEKKRNLRNVVIYEDATIRHGVFNPLVRNFVLKTFLEFMKAKQLLICDGEARTLLFHDKKIYLSISDENRQQLLIETRNLSLRRSYAIMIYYSILRLIFRIDH